AAEIGLAQLVALDHRAHGAVKDEDAFAEQAGEVATTGVRRWRIGQAGIRHGESRKCGEKAKNARKPTLDGNKMDRHPPADDTVPPRTGASGAARARKVNGKQEGAARPACAAPATVPMPRPAPHGSPIPAGSPTGDAPGAPPYRERRAGSRVTPRFADEIPPPPAHGRRA